MHLMGNGLRNKLHRRRIQRWLRREALLLASEVDEFDCPEMRLEATRLLTVTGGFGNGPALRIA